MLKFLREGSCEESRRAYPEGMCSGKETERKRVLRQIGWKIKGRNEEERQIRKKQEEFPCKNKSSGCFRNGIERIPMSLNTYEIVSIFSSKSSWFLCEYFLQCPLGRRGELLLKERRTKIFTFAAKEYIWKM